MSFPDWWALTLLALAAYRVYRLLSTDTLLDIPRAKIVGLGGWKEGQPVPPGYRQTVAEFLVCAWCLGFWISLAWWGAWTQWPHGTLVVAAPLAVSTLVGLVSQLDRSE